MRKQIAAAVLAGLTMLVSGVALADGMPRGSIKDAPVAMPSWSGFYLGGAVGYGHMVGDNKYVDDVGGSQSWTTDSAAGGFASVLIGFDRLVRERYVVGMFADFDWGSMEGRFEDDAGEQAYRLNRVFSVGGRAGFLMTPTSLLYATAGYSWGHIKSNEGYFLIDGIGKSSIDLHGPFVGLGMETQLGRNWSLRGEARYTMFDDVVTSAGTSGPATWVDKLDANLLTARLAVVYKFNRDEPREAPIK